MGECRRTPLPARTPAARDLRRSPRTSSRATSRSSWTAMAAGPSSEACPARPVTRRGSSHSLTACTARSSWASARCRPTPSPRRTGSARPTRCASSWASTAMSCTGAATRCTRWACASAGPGAPSGCGRASSRSWSTPRSSPRTTMSSPSPCASTTGVAPRSPMPPLPSPAEWRRAASIRTRWTSA